MKPWERLLFSVTSLAILAIIGLKLNEVDLAVARFVRSFDILEINRAGDVLAFLGRGEVIAGLFLVVRLVGWELKQERVKRMATRGLVAILGVTVVAEILKHLIGRPRPRSVHADYFSLGPSFAEGRDSFPSGHTINAFGAASVVAWFFPGLRGPVLILAGTVGLARVLRGAHFPTDVFAGAVLGVLVGSLAAAGYKDWREEVLPGMMKTGVPICLFLFMVVWVALHRMSPGPQEILYMGMGTALVLLGGLSKGLGESREDETGDRLRTAGRLAVIIGVAIACMPWWGIVLLLVALLPIGLDGLSHPPAFPRGGKYGGTAGPGKRATSLAIWGREAVTVGAALLLMAALESLKGMILIG
jgi:undecaprenyl-diphosphatase